jgi:hypothetical protein
MDAGFLFARNDLRVVVSLGVQAGGYLENLLGTKFDAKTTALAPFWNEVDLALGHRDLLEV